MDWHETGGPRDNFKNGNFSCYQRASSGAIRASITPSLTRLGPWANIVTHAGRTKHLVSSEQYACAFCFYLVTRRRMGGFITALASLFSHQYPMGKIRSIKRGARIRTSGFINGDGRGEYDDVVHICI